MSARALINVPKQAKRGEVIEIKTLISHQMETGFRHGTNGQMIPRDIITTFTAKYEGEEIFSTTLYRSVKTPFSGLALRGGVRGPHADGWGLALYEGRAVRTFLEPAAAAKSPLAKYIRENPIRIGIAKQTRPIRRRANNRTPKNAVEAPTCPDGNE